MYFVIGLEFLLSNMLHKYAYIHVLKATSIKQNCLKRPKILYPKVAFSAVISPGHTVMILSTINHDCNSRGEFL